MKRLSRHTVVVIVVALLSCVGGLSLAVVAFGQSGSDLDATVPLGDYTATTPATGTQQTTTAPLSGYGPSTTPTTPAQTTSTPSKGQSGPSSTSGGSHPSSSSSTHHASTATSSGGQPSRATRQGPTHLAFTGGEPMIVGAAGMALMLAGLGLQLRRRRRSQFRA
jgi:hypothetical protein